MANKNYYEYTSQNPSYLSDLNPTPIMMGVVENSADPLMLGRVQVRIPSLHKIVNSKEPYISDYDLPWAKPGIMNSAGNDYGQYLPPVPGTRVWVLFEDGDPDKPVYLGGVPTLIGNTKIYNKNNPRVLGGEFEVYSNDTPAEITGADPTRYIIYKSIKGATIYVSEEDYNEYISIVDQNGQTITMGNVGNNKLNRRGGALEVNDDSYISISHNQYINTILDKDKIKLTYQKTKDPLDDYDHTISYEDQDKGNPNDKYSITLSDEGINIESEDINKVMINGIPITKLFSGGGSVPSDIEPVVRKIIESYGIIDAKPTDDN